MRPTNAGYFIPETHLYREIYKSDRRSAKEIEYIHSAGTWNEHASAALELAFECTDGEQQGKLLHVAREYLSASTAVLSTRTYHHQLVLQKGVKTANKLADIVESKALARSSVVPSPDYQAVLGELSGKYVVEASKQLAKDAL